MTSGHKLRIGVLGAILAAFLIACSGGSSSNLEASLRAQLSETQTQLEQAQELIVNLQAEIAASETAAIEPEPEVEPIVEEETSEEVVEDPSEDEIDTLLTGTYLWLQESDDTARLQEFLGVEADGWYGSGTRAAHITALEARELPVSGVPEIPCTSQDPIEEAIGSIDSSGDPIQIDIDGDGDSDEIKTVVIGDSAYITALTSYNGQTSWVQFGTWGSFSAADAAYNPEFGTDINEDGVHEIWVKVNPYVGPAGGAKEHFVYVFTDCTLQVVTNSATSAPVSFYRGNTVSGETYYINCEKHEGESLLVYHEDYRIGEPEDFVWAFVPTALRLTGTSVEEVISSAFEDDIAPAPDPLPTDNCPKYS